MHPPVRDFVIWCVDQIPKLTQTGHVLEVGSLNVNGEVRDLFTWADSYTGLDITPGPGVELVADARTWVPDRLYDVVVSTEALEHIEHWDLVMDTILAACKPGGYIILTCATTGRGPHNQHGSATFPEGEYYGNVSMSHFAACVETSFTSYTLNQTSGCDLQFFGQKR